MKKINDFIADRLSLILSMMATFYIILALVIIPLFYTVPTNLVGWAQYLCSVVFQGVALPVLGYTARKASDKSDVMMSEMYKMTQHIEKLTKHIEKQQDMITKLAKHIDAEVDEIIEI